MEFETNYVQAQLRAGHQLGNVGKTRMFFKNSRLSTDQVTRLLERVDGDAQRFQEIQMWAKKLYPFDKSLILEGVQKVNYTEATEEEDTNPSDETPAVYWGQKGKKDGKNKYQKGKKAHWSE